MGRDSFARSLRISAGQAASCLALVASVIFAASLNAQQGPLKPTPSGNSAPAQAKQTETPKVAPSAAAPVAKPALSTDAPEIPVDQIIQQFAAHEAEFRIERDNYTYTQTFSMQTIDLNGKVDGEYRMTSEIVFTPEGKRYENVTFAPPPTLERIQLTQQDLDDLEHVQPFVLTTTELPKYTVKYVGHEPLDELNTYVFDVGPKTLEKNQRYFQGRIWVDDKDFAVVKTDGKAVPDIKKKNNENVFPRFETFRENIEGHYWFPTYTRSNDTLHFSGDDVKIRMSVRYENYKRYGVTIKIGTPTETDKNKKP